MFGKWELAYRPWIPWVLRRRRYNMFMSAKTSELSRFPRYGLLCAFRFLALHNKVQKCTTRDIR